jgi:hypothetical protein
VPVGKHIRLHNEQISRHPLCEEPAAIHLGMNMFDNYTDSSIHAKPQGFRHAFH